VLASAANAILHCQKRKSIDMHKVLMGLMVATSVLANTTAKAQTNQIKMKKKVLFAVTSHNQKGNTRQPTGYYLSEVSHPWEVLRQAGYEIDFVSPQGGTPPVDGFDLSDAVNRKFWEDKDGRAKIDVSLRPDQVRAQDYVAIFYAGGHGAMWDLAENTGLSSLAAAIYENNGIVSAVCHGPAGLVNIRLSDGSYLISGKAINAFTNEEEIAVNMDKVVPFSLESKLIEVGARFEKSGPWQTHVTVDSRVVTGQNPQSAHAVGQAIKEQLNRLGL
jgi:putative intracellular protease/amidase